MVDASRHRCVGNGLAARRGVDHQQIGGRAHRDVDSRQADALASVVADHPVGVIGELMAGHHQQSGGFQGIASADLVVDVLHVVGAGRDRHPGVA